MHTTVHRCTLWETLCYRIITYLTARLIRKHFHRESEDNKISEANSSDNSANSYKSDDSTSQSVDEVTHEDLKKEADF